ncbi:MAG: hypothetical protein V1682_03675 [Candidatus Omnitrophota bacterium]
MKAMMAVLTVPVFIILLASGATAQDDIWDVQDGKEAEEVIKAVAAEEVAVREEAVLNEAAEAAPAEKESPVVVKKAAIEEDAPAPVTKVKRDPLVANKEVTGQVSGLAKNFIAVIYEGDISTDASKEAAFPIEGTPVLERMSSLDDLKEGDTVTVRFEDTTTFDDSGKETTARKIEKITFVRPAPAAVVAPMSAESIEEQAVNSAVEAE